MADNRTYGVYLGKDRVSTYFKNYLTELPDIELTELNITPGKNAQTFTPELGSAYSTVNVAGDNNLISSNIRVGVSIFGVAGSMTETVSANLREATVTPSTSTQTITPPYGYDGYSIIRVNRVTSSIDPDIIPENIKAGVNILGVTGTLTQAGVLTPYPDTITINGTYDFSNYSTVHIDIPTNTEVPAGYILPQGQYPDTITENGTYNIREYETVKINVPVPSGYLIPSGNKSITTNGSNIDVSSYETVSVNVPVPSGYIIPSGTKSITSNGSSIDVKNYAYVNVAVPTAKPEQSKTVTPMSVSQTVYPDSGKVLSSVVVNAIPSNYIIPSGSQYITSNGTYNISSKESVEISVPIPPGYIIPSGNKNITSNGTDIDVSQYSTVSVNINTEIHNFIYSATEPSYAAVGTVWFKPVE